MQTGQSRLHNFKDDEHARALWGAYACSKHRYSVADTRFCLGGLPSRSSRGSARLRPKGFDAAAFSRFAGEGWWSRSGSNRRPQACKARALPTELRPQKSVQSGLPSRSCGRKPVFAPTGSDAAAFAALQRRLVGPGRVERPTSRLSGVRSNHLSYEPETRGYGFRITSPRQSR